MWILRLLGVLVLVAVAGGFVSYLLTGNVKYLRFAGRSNRYSMLVADGVVRGDTVLEVAWTIWSVAHGMVSLEIAEGVPRRAGRRDVYDRALRVMLDGWSAQPARA